MTLRHCPLKGCTLERKPNQAMCFRHWRMVPRALQERLFQTFRIKPLGQEWVEAFQAAVEAAARADTYRSKKEGGDSVGTGTV